MKGVHVTVHFFEDKKSTASTSAHFRSQDGCKIILRGEEDSQIESFPQLYPGELKLLGELVKVVRTAKDTFPPERVHDKFENESQENS